MTIREIDIRQDISFACVTTLISGLDLIDPRVSEEDRLLQVGSGIYGLIPYAIEYWITHLFLFASKGGPLEERHPLSLHLSSLLYKHNELLHFPEDSISQPFNSDEYPPQSQLDSRLELLIHLPIHTLVNRILQIRWLSDQKSCEDGQGKSKKKERKPVLGSSNMRGASLQTACASRREVRFES